MDYDLTNKWCRDCQQDKDNCPDKQEDTYGLLCDLSCGKHSMYVNYQAGIKEVVDWIRKVRNIGFVDNPKDMKQDQVLIIELKDWQAKLEEWGI